MDIGLHDFVSPATKVIFFITFLLSRKIIKARSVFSTNLPLDKVLDLSGLENPLLDNLLDDVQLGGHLVDFLVLDW